MTVSILRTKLQLGNAYANYGQRVISAPNISHNSQPISTSSNDDALKKMPISASLGGRRKAFKTQKLGSIC